MSYYTGRGDYYRARGDPGFTSILSGILGTAGKVVGAVPGVGSVVGGALTGASKLLGGGSSTRPLTVPTTVPTIRQPQPVPGLTGMAQRIVPGGASGYTCGSGNACGPGFHLDKTKHEKCVRNRRTNYANPRALSRASKRIDGFVAIARKAMKSTNYKVVSKSYKQNWRKPLKR